MKCPDCGEKLGVIDMVKNDEEIYRRRKCKKCGRRMYTIEFEVEPDDNFHSTWHKCDIRLRRERYLKKKGEKRDKNQMDRS